MTGFVYKRNRIFKHSDNTSTSLLGYSDLECETGKKERLYVTPSGKRYPSITTILSLRGREFIQAWRAAVGEEEANRVSRHACTRGTALHTLAEKYLNNEETVLATNEMPHVVQLFKVLQTVLDKSIGEIVLQECPLFSDHFEVAGRVDLVAEFDGILSIIDFKTSKRIKDASDISNYFIQSSFYAASFYERTGIPIKQIVIVMVVDGHSQPLVFKEESFKWLPELLKIREEYSKAKLFGHI
jgi:genome maintenance exonuclease 1